ncbi:MAG TPA: hypothetical protein VGN01_08940 [Acidobacteriaceae bacterium]|jgi:hypothetical protein
MRWLPVLLLLSFAGVAAAQAAPQAQPPQPASQAAPAPASQPALQLSPQAAYDLAAHPLDITRRPVENWSEVEQAALKVATGQAKNECLARTPYQFTGEDLLAYARLCAFAQQWEPVQQAATSYLIAQKLATPAEQATGFPNLAMAFDYEIQASLHLGNHNNAFGTAQTMLRTVPYDDVTSEATNAVVRYVQLIQTDQAISLLQQRQPLLLALLKAGAAPGPAPAASLHPPLNIHELYADAIDLPSMQQFANRPKDAADSFAELEAALPAAMSPDDTIMTRGLRRQYLLLGAHMPPLNASALLLQAPFTVPRDLNTRFGTASVFLLFPNWCAQCVRMGSQFFATASARLAPNYVHFYGLLAQDDPGLPITKPTPKPAAKAVAGARFAKPEAVAGGTLHVDVQITAAPNPAVMLMGTPTLVVPPATLDTFVAADFPLIIATDFRGIIRYIRPAPDNALVRDALVDQLADRIIQQWPGLERDIR